MTNITMLIRTFLLLVLLAGLVTVVSCSVRHAAGEGDVNKQKISYLLQHDGLELAFNQQLHSRISLPGARAALSDFTPGEVIELDGEWVQDFAFTGYTQSGIETELGEGKRIVLTGVAKQGVEKAVQIDTHARYPGTAFYRVTYTNISRRPIKITRWLNNQYQLLAPANKQTDQADFWAYQGASFSDRRDWVRPLAAGFYQQNYMGMNASDYGGGTPVSDVWRKDAGLAVGHVETSPKLVSLPVDYQQETGVRVGVELEKNQHLAPGESFTTLQTFVRLHQGDYYASLKTYRQVMADKGLKMQAFPDSAYQPIWCAWGYERNFTLQEVLNTLPRAKALGLEWAVLDDGWQTAEGDWYLNPQKFPDGDASMRGFVEQINQAGLRAKLWWAPLAVDPGTDLLHKHSDMLLLDQWGAVQDVTWWNSFYLCPAYAGTIEYTKALVRKMFTDWGYEGLKIDGQHLNGVAPCYNPAHKHAYPEESVEKLADFWQMVYQTAIEIKPDAVIEVCPCGTSYAFHNLPYMNQTVSSDPLSSWQVRLKGKTLKGLMGDNAPYYGDHVELSDNASDFASSLGIGAVVGTKFTLPSDNTPESDFMLDSDRQQTWAKWIALYNSKMLSKGKYLGELYDIGFDRPETHAIRKNDTLYYAFYADSWQGKVNLKGLDSREYQVVDYVNNQPLGRVTGPLASLQVAFADYLLLELTPVAD